MIYGLKQASHTWNSQLHGVLTGLGFKRTIADAGIYVKSQREGDLPLFVIVYVDDITILGASLEAVKLLKSDLSKRYEMSDLGEITSYLRIHITRDRSLRRLCNGHYNRTPDLGKCGIWWNTWDLARHTILDTKVLDRNVTWLTKHKDTS